MADITVEVKKETLDWLLEKAKSGRHCKVIYRHANRVDMTTDALSEKDLALDSIIKTIGDIKAIDCS